MECATTLTVIDGCDGVTRSETMKKDGMIGTLSSSTTTNRVKKLKKKKNCYRRKSFAKMNFSDASIFIKAKRKREIICIFRCVIYAFNNGMHTTYQIYREEKKKHSFGTGKRLNNFRIK